MTSIHKATIYGPAGSKGSQCTFPHPKTGAMVTIESSAKGRSWEQRLVQEMLEDQPSTPFDEALFMRLRIYVSRPKSHFRKDGSLKPNMPLFPCVGLDVDKVQRAAGDAAQKARWFLNDARIAGWDSLRLYTKDRSEPERVIITMFSLEFWGLGFLEKMDEKQRQREILEAEENEPQEYP